MHAPGPLPAPVDDGNAAAPLVLDAASVWGASQRVLQVAQAKRQWLQREGWRYGVLAPGARGAGCIDSGGIGWPGSAGLRTTWRRGPAEALIEQAQPALVEAVDPLRMAWAVRAATARLNVPAVAYCHANLPLLLARFVGGPDGVGTPRGRWAARRARAYLKRLYEGFELVLAPSAGMADRLRSWGIVAVRVQPLGVDCATFHPRARDPVWRRALCAHLGLPDDTRLLVTSGHYGPENNLAMLCQAMKMLGPGHALLAVGSGRFPPRGERVFRLPPASERPTQLARLLASADAYVHAGDQETFGLGTLQAMACGTPVVVSAAGGQGELVRDVGLTVPRNHAVDWAEALRSALEDGGSAWVHLALARARDHDWRPLMQRLSRHYLTLLGQVERAPPLRAVAGR